MFPQEKTRISKSSQRIRTLPPEVEPELEDLIPADPELNLAAYSRFLEALLRAQMEG